MVSPVRVLTYVDHAAFQEQHGHLLSELLRRGEITIAGFERIVTRVPRYRHIGPSEIGSWMAGNTMPGSPIPLLLAVTLAAPRSPDLASFLSTAVQAV
jgi:hypothetical protein